MICNQDRPYLDVNEKIFFKEDLEIKICKGERV